MELNNDISNANDRSDADTHTNEVSAVTNKDVGDEKAASSRGVQVSIRRPPTMI
jgi:hypothetical protein